MRVKTVTEQQRFPQISIHSTAALATITYKFNHGTTSAMNGGILRTRLEMRLNTALSL